MKTDPGIQSAFPWFTGQQELQPIEPEPDPIPQPEALGLRLLAAYQPKRSH